MGINGTPRDLAYTAAKWLTIFIGAVILLYVAEASWFYFRNDVIEEESLGTRLLAFPLVLIFFIDESTVLAALRASVLGWIIVFPGLFLANGAQRFAAFVFGVATVIAATGFSGEYWFAAIPSVLAIGYLTIWAWSLRNQIPVVTTNGDQAAHLVQQREALLDREISQEDVISRK